MREFPVYRIEGGPTARSIRIWRNDEELHVTDWSASASVKGVVAVTIREYAQFEATVAADEEPETDEGSE